jgi:hypothetical protein
MITKKYLIVLFILFLLVFTKTSFAGPITIGALGSACSVGNVTLNSIKTTDGFLPASGELLSASYNASKCAGVYGGNDDGGLSDPNPNIGQFEDGLLNGQDEFTGLEFITAGDLQALDPDGIKNDPGWIHLAHFDADDANDADGGIDYSETGPAPGGDPNLILDIGDLLTLELSCTNGNLSDCDSMNWVLTTKLGIIDQVQSLLGPSTFDHLAFSIKAGNANSNPAGGFAVYDFNFNDIFAIENNPLLNFNTPYKLGGTLNTANLGGHGVSHLNVWARDPIDSTTVPEPSTLVLLGISFIVINLKRLIRACNRFCVTAQFK